MVHLCDVRLKLRVFNLLLECPCLIRSATPGGLQSIFISDTPVTCTPAGRGAGGGEPPAWHITENLGGTLRSRTRRP